MATVDMDALSTGLKESRKTYEEIFGLRLDDGFGAGRDFVSLPVKQKYDLVRVILSNITQPGQTNAINHATSFMTLKNRTGELKPGKVDLLFDETTIQKKFNTSFLAQRQPNDPKDIHSVAGQQFIMQSIMSQVGAEINAGIYSAVWDDTTGIVGGTNLFDGFGFKFLKGYATSGTGFIGDIPAANKVTGAAGSVTSSNILAELTKLFTAINALAHIRQEMNNPAYAAINYSIYLPLSWKFLVDSAIDALPYKNDSVVRYDSATNTYIPKYLNRTTLKFRSWMDGTDNMFFSPDDNLFWLTEENANSGATAESVVKLKIQEKDRGFQILLDWMSGVDYADGRFIVLYK